MRNFIVLLVFCFSLVQFSYSQRMGLDDRPVNVYPTSWWIGMKQKKLQLMIHAEEIGKAKSVDVDYPGVKLIKVNRVEGSNYLFLDLVIETNAKPGTFLIDIVRNEEGNNRVFSRIHYELKPRRKGNGTEYAQGVRSQDFMYLIMPDRFANGEYNNDKLLGYKDQSLNRDSMYHRHGGDIQGVIDHLDYLKDLGVTTVWLTPVLENNMPNRTEHGYAITNHYKVDERHGGNAAYKKLGDELHKRGMKLIQDAVYNHVGLYNFLVQDPPMKDWLNKWDKYTQTNYKDQTVFDPYGSKTQKKVMQDGWFTRQMPDLNQNNPYVSNFLIQHAIWSVEEFGVDGWRIDTYIYNDLDFMNRCNKALTDEYPKMTMFGETWVHGTANQAYFAQNNMNVPFKSNLIGVTDFQTLYYGITPALNQDFGWTEGVNKLYQTLSNDFLYKDPYNNVIFLDNHDMTRFFSTVKEDVDKLKMGIGWLLTSRGVPEMYYGTEILLKGVSDPDGKVRQDFPGGWKEDQQNKFTEQGRSDSENVVFNWTRTIANFRKNSSAIKTGRLMQFYPEDWVYTYFRYNDKQTVMVVMNTSSDEKTLDPKKFSERTAGFSKARNISNSSVTDISTSWKIPGKTIWIMELQK
jgi:neopullulanase